MESIRTFFGNKPGVKPNPLKGLYTALAIFLPLLILTVIGRSPLGVLILFGALVTSFGDVVASPRIRVYTLGIATVGGALMTGLGRVIGGPWWLEVVELFLVVLLNGLLAAYGQTVASIGLLMTIPLVLSLANPGGPATAFPAAGGFLLGGAILLLFAFVFAWLQSRHHPSKNAVRPDQSGPTLATPGWSSSLLLFSFLRALGAAIAVEIGWHLGGPYPYWAVLTIITCARTDQKTSLKIVVQNIVATFLGAFLANIAIASVQNVLVLGVIIVAVAFLAFTFKDLNYTIHLFFFTNLILLLLSIGNSGHSFAPWRIFSILLGAGIVLVITFLNQALTAVGEHESSMSHP